MAQPTAEQIGGGSAPQIVHIFPTFAVGGAQVRFTSIANHFGPAFRHLVVALDGNTACRERLRPDLSVDFPTIEAPKNAMLANAWRFRCQLREWRPDTLVTYNWGAIEFALANIVPVTRHIHVVDGFGPEERATQIPRRIWLRRLALGRTPVVLPSQNLVRIASDIWKLPRAVIRYVPNGVDLVRFRPGAAGHEGNLVIGTIAALREEKHVGRLLRAFARLASSVPARLIVVGDGPQRGMLTALASELGVAERVAFVGHQSDTPGFYQRFDIFALSSDTEQMPLSVIEAMACGLPVVSTDVGDVRAMVAEQNAPYITALDDTALTSALQGLAVDPALRLRIGAANREKSVREFDEAKMFAAHGTLWRGDAGRE